MMNLAEIRKKALQERESPRIGQPLTAEVIHPPEVQVHEKSADAVAPDARIVTIPPQIDLTPEPEASRVTPQPAASAPQQPVHSLRAPHLFDPLKTILAGRAAMTDSADPEVELLHDQIASTFLYEEYLCFKVGNERYAVNIMDIKEIVKPREVTEVPRAPAFIPGIISLRGVIIPVFNLRARLHLPSVADSSKSRIIIVKRGSDFCGVLVDEVIQVVRIAADEIENPPNVLDGVDREFVRGIGRYDGKMLILLNMETILDIGLI